MEKIITVLNGHSMLNKKQVHEYLISRFNFPDYYGKNLDALYDLMSTYQQPEKLVILLIYPEVLFDHLGEYGVSLIQTFIDASRVNPNIDFRVKDAIVFNESEVF